MVKTLLADSISDILSYRTFKIVTIRNWKLGLVHYLVQLIILGFVVGFILIYKKGYQSQGSLIGNVSIKVKGNSWFFDGNRTRVWDEYDSDPNPSTDSFFVTSTVHPTYHQKRDTCYDPSGDAKCKSDEECILRSAGQGVTTGYCNTQMKQCLLDGWCPMEDDDSPSHHLIGVDAFTAFVKVQVYFPDFDINRNNVNGSAGQLTPGYNLFSVAQLLDMASANLTDITKHGAIFMINVDYACNFDRDPEECNPSFSVIRIDTETQLSTGYNFRYTHFYWVEEDGELVEYRDLFKVYGPRFLVSLSGYGRKFDVFPLFLSIGSSVGLVSLASIFVDFIALYLTPQRKRYMGAKYEVTGEEFMPILREHISANAPPVKRKEKAISELLLNENDLDD